MKKRREFVAVEYEYSSEQERRSVKFTGESEQGALILSSTTSGISVELADMSNPLALKSAGLIGRVGLLILSFGQSAELSRIGVFVGHLNHVYLDRDLRELTSKSSVSYRHIQPRQRIVVTNEGCADDGSVYQAIVWSSETDAKGLRVTLSASDPFEAKAELKRRFGEDAICTAYNERQASAPRD